MLSANEFIALGVEFCGEDNPRGPVGDETTLKALRAAIDLRKQYITAKRHSSTGCDVCGDRWQGRCPLCVLAASRLRDEMRAAWAAMGAAEPKKKRTRSKAVKPQQTTAVTQIVSPPVEWSVQFSPWDLSTSEGAERERKHLEKLSSNSASRSAVPTVRKTAILCKCGASTGIWLDDTGVLVRCENCGIKLRRCQFCGNRRVDDDNPKDYCGSHVGSWTMSLK